MRFSSDSPRSLLGRGCLFQNKFATAAKTNLPQPQREWTLTHTARGWTASWGGAPSPPTPCPRLPRPPTIVTRRGAGSAGRLGGQRARSQPAGPPPTALHGQRGPRAAPPAPGHAEGPAATGSRRHVAVRLPILAGGPSCQSILLRLVTVFMGEWKMGGCGGSWAMSPQQSC